MGHIFVSFVSLFSFVSFVLFFVRRVSFVSFRLFRAFGEGHTGLEQMGLEYTVHFERNCQSVPRAAGAPAGAAAA